MKVASITAGRYHGVTTLVYNNHKTMKYKTVLLKNENKNVLLIDSPSGNSRCTVGDFCR